MKPVRVAITSRLNSSENPGGIEAVVEELLPRLRRLHPEWEIAAIGAFRRKTRWNNLPVLGDVLAGLRFARAARRVDVLVVNGAEYAFPLGYVREAAAKTVVVWHGTRAFEVPALVPHVGPLLRVYVAIQNALQAAALRCRTQIAITPKVVDEMRSVYGDVGAPVVIPNGVPVIPPLERESRTGGPFVVAWSGTTPYKKGLDIAIAACAAARAAIPSLELHVAGLEPPHEPSEPWVVWHGPVARDRARAIVAGAGVFLSTARYEGFSIAILEAVALGIPVVASPASGWAVEGIGLPVEGYEPISYARALERVFANPPERSVLLQGTARYQRAFDWDGIAEKYAQEIARVLPAPPAPESS